MADWATESFRLDEALRAFTAEQGSKRMRKDELWRLVGGSMRLRLTAHAVAGLSRGDEQDIGAARDTLGARTERLDAWYEQLAVLVGKPHGQGVATLAAPTFDGGDGAEHSSRSHHAIWLFEHLDHLTEHLGELVRPAARLAEIRRRPWWR